MKKELVAYVSLLAFLLSSCSSVVCFQKRHYRKGWYVHTSTTGKNTLASSPRDVIQISKSQSVEPGDTLVGFGPVRFNCNTSHNIRSGIPVEALQAPAYGGHTDADKKIQDGDTLKKAKRKQARNDVRDQEVYKQKARAFTIQERIYFMLSLFFLLAALLVPPIIVITLFMTGPLAVIFHSIRKRYEILARLRTDLTEEEKRAAELDKQESRQAFMAGVISLLLLLAWLACGAFAVWAVILLIWEGIPFLIYGVLLYLGAVILGTISVIYSARKGKKALEYGRRVLRRHPDEKYYLARRRAVFGKRVGILSYIYSVLGYMLIALFVLAGILLLFS